MVGRRLVEDEELGFTQHCAVEGYELLLPQAHGLAGSGHHGV